MASTFADRRDSINEALQRIPRALEVLDRERPNLTNALTKLGTFSDTANRLVNDSQADLVTNLKNLQPTFKALADVGPEFDQAIAYATVFPYGQNLIDRAVRGDFINLFATVDISGPRLRKSIFLGTRAGQEGRDLVPVPGDPYFQRYTYDPLGRPLAPPAARGSALRAAGESADAWIDRRPAGRVEKPAGAGVNPEQLPSPPLPMPPVIGPVLPVVPQSGEAGAVESPPPPDGGGPIFAGPYSADSPQLPAAPTGAGG